ncbi:hypothetical protein Q5530_19725 [Saccharothrix sp. BKS2]|uniref:hypothetical protein n=1 Tax=Saccharothrix sp. BKS2 TaxID=3064400 RepID=UPI0039E8FC85
MTCQGKPVPTAAWDDLGAGARSAFAADRTSRKRGAHPRGALAEDPVSASFPQWAGTVTTAVKRNTAEDRNAAALHCVVPAAWVWTRTPRRLTALLPQVNYNGVQDRTDHQSDLLGSVALNRDPDWVLSESYPEAGLDAFSVNQELTQHWVGKKGQEHNFGYLTQPDLLFAARGTDQDDVRALTIAGIVLGIAGSLVVSALARLVDVVAELVAPERPTGT